MRSFETAGRTNINTCIVSKLNKQKSKEIVCKFAYLQDTF